MQSISEINYYYFWVSCGETHVSEASVLVPSVALIDSLNDSKQIPFSQSLAFPSVKWDIRTGSVCLLIFEALGIFGSIWKKIFRFSSIEKNACMPTILHKIAGGFKTTLTSYDWLSIGGTLLYFCDAEPLFLALYFWESNQSHGLYP